jgi:hypothetical protein
MNLLEDMDLIYVFHGQTYTVTSEQLKKIKKNIRDATMIARLEMLNVMDEESKEKLRKEKYIQYYRINRALGDPQTNDFEPTPKLTNDPLPLNTNPTPASKCHKNDDIQLNLDLTNFLAKINVHVSSVS